MIMAKKFTVTASVNGGSSTSHDVTCKDSEPVMSQGWLWRMYEAFGFSTGQTATFVITSISGPTNISDPMSWSGVPSTLLIAVTLGQISLAFIE